MAATRAQRLIPWLAAAALALASCQGKAQRPACPAGWSCLEYGLTTEPATLDPHRANLASEITIISDLMTGLTTEASDGHPVPGAAASWETGPDGLIWTFHLRHDGRWSDGTPVTAEDFVFGLRRVLDPRTAAIYAYLAYVLKNGQAVNQGKAPLEAVGARALDPWTLQLTLEHPAPYLLELAKHPSFFPAPRQVVARYGDGWVAPGRYVSNGAYRLVSWRLGDHIEAMRNPWFTGPVRPKIDRIDYDPTPDAVSAERRVQRGELDINTSFQSNRLAHIRATMPGYAHVHSGLDTVYLSFNRRFPMFRDRRVRRALSEAIDRDFITGKLLRAGQIPAYAFVPPGTAGYAPGPRTRWAAMTFAQRQGEARALLAAAGYSAVHPLTIELKTTNNSGSLLVVEAIQADWRAVGVNAAIAQNDGPVAFSAFAHRDFQVGAMDWYADFNDPLTFLGLLKSDTGAQNYGDYRNGAYDALLSRADLEPDAVRRAQVLAQAEQLMLDEDALAPLYFAVNRDLISPRVTGWADNAPDFHRAMWLALKR